MQLVKNCRHSVTTICVVSVGLVASLFCPDRSAFADTGVNVTVTTPEGKPAEGGEVTLKPIFPKGSNGKTVTTGKDGKASFSGEKEGDYSVTVVSGGTTTTYYIHVSKDKTTEQKSSEEGPLSVASTFDAATIDRIVDAINGAATRCDRKLYDKLVAAFNAFQKSAQAQLDELDKLVSDAHDKNNLPTDTGGLDDIKSLPMTADAKAAYDAYYALVEERERLKAAVDLIKAKEKNILRVAKDCAPPKTGAGEAPKTETPPSSNKPRQ